MKTIAILACKLLRFAGLPLKYIDADGAPVRAVAMEE